jgi:uncharacterized membrane protein YfbV (UPF0208 family)
LIAYLGVGAGTASVFSIDWRTALGTSVLAAILSALMSLDRSTAVISATTSQAESTQVPTVTVDPVTYLVSNAHSYDESLR